MSKQISIPLFVHAKPAASYEYGANVINGMKFELWEWEDMADNGYVLVCPATVCFELPEGWDPRPAQIKTLEAKREQLQKEFSEAVMKINQQIATLQAIEYTPTATADTEVMF